VRDGAVTGVGCVVKLRDGVVKVPGGWCGAEAACTGLRVRRLGRAAGAGGVQVY